MISEEQIIDRVLNGETDLFGLLVERYHERIFVLSREYVHHVQDAEDITQETFLKAFISLGSFKGKSEFSTWLYRIAVNTAYSFLKKEKFKKTLSVEFIKEDIIERVHSNLNDVPHRQLTSKESQKLIYKEIDKLPKRQREAFILSRIDQMSQRDIAKIMSISVSAVDSLVQRAKRNLEKKLKLFIDENEL